MRECLCPKVFELSKEALKVLQDLLGTLSHEVDSTNSQRELVKEIETLKFELSPSRYKAAL